MCARQVERREKALETAQDGVGVNNRVVQPLYQRVVTQTTTEAPRPPPVRPEVAAVIVLALFLLASLVALLYYRNKYRRVKGIGAKLVELPGVGMLTRQGTAVNITPTKLASEREAVGP